MYVDYIEMDSKHHWIQPDYYNYLDKGHISYVDKLSTDILKLVNALHNAGSRPEALEIIASRWRPVKMSDNYRAKPPAKRVRIAKAVLQYLTV